MSRRSWLATAAADSVGPSSARLSDCSPRDKRIVREPDSEADVWWGEGSPNYEMDER